MNYGEEYENIEDDLYNEASQVINGEIGEKITEQQREELLASLLPLFRRCTGDFNDSTEEENVCSLPANDLTNLYNSSPHININFANPPMMPQYYPCYGCFQQPVILQNPYYYQQYQMVPQYQLVPQPIPAFQQPNVVYLVSQTVQAQGDSKKKSKKENKKSDKKSHKKSKDKHDKKHKDSHSRIETFELKPGNQFNGIIHYLTEKTGGNIHKNGTIELTSNSTISSANHQEPENVLDYQSNSCFGAKSGSKDFWVCFDFKNRKIEITDYTIQSYRFSSGHLKNWVLETSKDNENWTQIDQHSDDLALNGMNKIASFKANPKGFARYCRIRHTGEFWDYRPFASPGFSKIEFYGRLKSKKA